MRSKRSGESGRSTRRRRRREKSTTTTTETTQAAVGEKRRDDGGRELLQTGQADEKPLKSTELVWTQSVKEMLLCRYWRSVLIDSFATFWLNAPHFFSWWANFSSFYDQVFVFSGDPGSATHQVDAATKETTTEIFSGITGAEVGIDLTIDGGGGGRDRDPG